ncbi:hypothetical protein BC941DRAFT_432201 [Chlamydoabsidia padenii]|nr:hypothetical protein BC941DRAFT_432201 [Chlamydoabsidia padenii]
MMTFEDIVDMDWLDSHSVKGEPMDLFPNDYVDFNHYLSADLLSPKLEPASSPPPLLLASSPPTTSSSFLFHPATSCSAAAALAAATTTPPPPPTFPSTEQIKQLIELAKHQLALRAAQSNNNDNNNNNSNASSSTSSSSDTNIVSDHSSITSVTSTDLVSATTTTTSDSNQQPTLSSSTSQLAAHLASTSLFGGNENLPDTVSPESLMKSTVTPSALEPQSTKKAQSPSLSSNTTIKIEEDTSMMPSSTPSLDDSLTTMDDPMKQGTTRRGSLGEEVGSLEAYAASGGIDIKKLTPRERRQLRNKISARNFRVRRKEYITTLEQQVSDHKKQAENLAERLDMVENENKQLRQQVDTLKRQNLLLEQQQQQYLQVC